MFPGIDRLKMLKVRDVMSRKVVEVSANQTMSEAADAFARCHVSSAPVVDDSGCCVGMLSAADIIKLVRPGDEKGRRYLTKGAPGDSSTNETSGNMVSHYMSVAPRSVAEDASLLHAARVMSADHIHHLPVLEDERPIGVVSTMDVVAALINAVDEVEVRLAHRHA